MSEEQILYEGDKHWVQKPKAMSDEKVVKAAWFDASGKEHISYWPIVVSDEGGNVMIEKSTDLLARQQAAKDTDGSVKYTPPSWRDNVAYGPEALLKYQQTPPINREDEPPPMAVDAKCPSCGGLRDE